MGLPMYVSPSLAKRQLPSKQPTSPPYTPQVEEDFEEAYQNSRTSAFDIPIPVPQSEAPQRGQRSRRSASLPYNNLVQQHIQRLHQLHQLHRTRTQQISSSNLASRRGLHSAHHLSLNHRALQAAQARRQNESALESVRNTREERLDDSHDEMIDFSFDDFVSSLDNNNHININNNASRSSDNDVGVHRNTHNDNDSSNHSHHNVALDNVIRINLLRQISQQEGRVMRSSRHHRSSTGHSSSGRSSRTNSSNINLERRRDDLVQRGIDIPPSSTIRHPSQLPEQILLYPNEHNATPLPPMPRLSAWHNIRRGINLPNDPRPQPPVHRRSSFADDFYSEVPHSYDEDHMSRILSPVPRRYDARFAANLASLPIGNEHELLDTNDIDNNRSNLDRVSNGNDSNHSIDPVRTEQRGSASGEVC